MMSPPADVPGRPRTIDPAPLRGQRALVTGASSGIGSGVALGLAHAGADVGVVYRSHKDEAEAVAEQIRSLGRQALILQADVSEEAAVDQMFGSLIEAWGRLDILVANAGLQRDANIDEMSLADWEKVLTVNLTGAFLCCRQAVRIFKRQRHDDRISRAAGKIICMSSVHEIIPWAGHVNYAASKGGMMLFMKSLALEVAPLKIRVNGIAPGAIRTPINRQAWEDEAALADLLSKIPIKRIGEVEDVAEAAVWLASDASDYIHGTSLLIDGGMALYPSFAEGG